MKAEVAKVVRIWSNREMSTEPVNLNALPPSELLSEVERLLEVVRTQQQHLQAQQEMIEPSSNLFCVGFLGQRPSAIQR
jgi:hypothetical protein